MCLAFPGKVEKVFKDSCLVSFQNIRKRILNGGQKVQNGDLVLVQMGIVIRTLSGEEYSQIMSVWDRLAQD